MINSILNEMIPVPHLPVYRETWCKQQQVDTISDIFFIEDNSLIIEKFMQIEHEDANPLAGHFSGLYMSFLGEIINFFNNNHGFKDNLPKTNLGIMDLIFELSQRLRFQLGLTKVNVIGKSLSDDINEGYPKLISLPIKTKLRNRSILPLSQEMIDEILSEAYESHPRYFYELAESRRFSMPIPIISYRFEQYIKHYYRKRKNNSELIEENEHVLQLLLESINRLIDMCDMPRNKIYI